MTKIQLLFRKMGSFGRSSSFVQIWFIPVWLMLGVGKLLVLLLPFRHLAPRLGMHAGASPWVPLLDADQESRALQISRVVRMAAAYTLWDSNCFPQAIAASFLLRWYGVPYMLFFGVAPSAKASKIQAHAWVAAGHIPVTGGVSFGEFTVVGCFAGRMESVSRDDVRQS